MSHSLTRRQFLAASAATASFAVLPSTFAAQSVELPLEHVGGLRDRRRRIVVQQDVYYAMRNYAKMHAKDAAPFAPFCDGVFAYVDEPGSQIDGIWWDIGGNTVGPVYPSKLQPPVEHPLLVEWLKQGTDWVAELVKETRRRKLEVFWNHRISEVDGRAEGGHEMQRLHPLKAEHPDWVVRSFWWQGMWNLAAPGLREYKVSLLRELVSNYDLDGIQIDFSRHIPCLPAGRQWEMRQHVTEFMRMTRQMLIEAARHRGHPVLLAAKVPETLAGCRMDGFDVAAWSAERLVDILTLGSRTMDVEVEAFRKAAGPDVQLQPCFDDHHATDGYRYGSIEFLRGVFANHWQRGANSVVTFNWSLGKPDVCRSIGGEVGPQTHQQAYREVGAIETLADKNKFFAVERRGGYPWADGYSNRNDNAPLPALLANSGERSSFTLHIADSPLAAHVAAIVRCVLFQAYENDRIEVRLNGTILELQLRDAAWKDPQIFSPAPQPLSGGTGDYRVNPRQQLVRLEFKAPADVWRQGPNAVDIAVAKRGPYPAASSIQLEKLECHLSYTRGEP